MDHPIRSHGSDTSAREPWPIDALSASRWLIDRQSARAWRKETQSASVLATNGDRLGHRGDGVVIAECRRGRVNGSDRVRARSQAATDNLAFDGALGCGTERLEPATLGNYLALTACGVNDADAHLALDVGGVRDHGEWPSDPCPSSIPSTQCKRDAFSDCDRLAPADWRGSRRRGGTHTHKR